MYKRDFGILIVAVCALYFSLHSEGTFSFKKAWYYHFEDEGGLLEAEPTLPPPLVADLNGDGKPEIIAASPTGTLKVLAARHSGDGFAQAQLLSEIPVAAKQASGEDESIAGLATGYITPQLRELVRAPRKQVVVVVTTDLRVICYDHNLRIVWEQDLRPHFPKHGSIRELAVHVSETAISVGDKGLIIVGASVLPPTLAESEEDDDDVFEEEEELEELERLHARGLMAAADGAANEINGNAAVGSDSSEMLMDAAGQQLTRHKGGKIDAEEVGDDDDHDPENDDVDGDTDHDEDEEEEEEEDIEEEEEGEDQDHSTEGRHFSYFAFEGGKGLLRWKHEAEDFLEDLGGSHPELVAAHASRLRAEQTEGKHYGEQSAREFRKAFLSVMPHSWNSWQDTRLELAHFKKEKDGKGAQKEQLSRLATSRSHPSLRSLLSASPVKNAVGDVVASVFRGAMHSGKGERRRNAHNDAPNVLVAHVEEGIEVIHLFSGRTVSRLHLPSPGLNADINGDGVPDHVVGHGGNPASVVLEPHSAAALAFCTMEAKSGVPPIHPLFNGTVCRPLRHARSRTTGLGMVEVAPPIMLPVPGRRGGYHAHGLGQRGLVVFLTSRGDLTALDWEGAKSWQLGTSSSWQATDVHAGDDDGDDEDEDAEDSVYPTLLAMPLRPKAVPTVILAAGQYSAVLVSEHGRVVDLLELPDVPIRPLVVTDFNFDGYNDIILLTKDGVYGWSQVRRPGAVPFSALVGGLIVILIGVFVTQQGFMQHSDGSNNKVRKGRSTERVD